MADYQKMYAVLCGAINDVLDALMQIPQTSQQVEHLYKALEKAESIYLQTAPDDAINE